MRTILLRRANQTGPTVPFEAELYAVAPERFGRWHESETITPSENPVALNRDQLRGEFALLILRWLCLAALASSGLGILTVLWRIVSR